MDGRATLRGEKFFPSFNKWNRNKEWQTFASSQKAKWFAYNLPPLQKTWRKQCSVESEKTLGEFSIASHCTSRPTILQLFLRLYEFLKHFDSQKKLFTFTAFNIHWLFDMEKFPPLPPPRPSFLIRINDFIVRCSFYTWTKQQKNRPLL